MIRLRRYYHGSILTVKDLAWLLGDILQDWGDKDKGDHFTKWWKTFGEDE